MTPEQIINLTKQMRIAQREYQASKSGASLSKSRGLERAVDQAITDHYKKQ